jgi:DNA polymerase/3'-5' exonuclease PolX
MAASSASTAAAPVNKNKRFLEGCNLLILLKGLKGGPARLSGLTKNAVDRGATVHTAVPSDATKLIVLTDIDYDATLKELAIERGSPAAARLTLADPEWLPGCARAHEKVRVEIYAKLPLRPSPTPASSSLAHPDLSHSPHTAIIRAAVGAAVDADPRRTRRDVAAYQLDSSHPLDRFQHSPRRSEADGEFDDDRDEQFVIAHSSTGEPRKPAMAKASPTGSVSSSRASPTRRVHFAASDSPSSSRGTKRTLDDDDPLRLLLSKEDEMQPAFGSPLGSDDDEHDGGSVARREPLNDVIISELRVIEQHARLNGDVHRANAYRNGVDSLSALQKPVFSLEDLRGVMHFKPGGSLWMKVGEVIATGSLQRAQFLRQSPEFSAKTALFKVFGVGPAEVQHFLSSGVQSVAQLRDVAFRAERGIVLTRAVEVGLQFYDDLLRRLSRAQVTEMFGVVEQAIHAVLSSAAVVMLCGSFRRGEETCSDVDILFTRKGGESMDGILNCVVTRLFSTGSVLARLSMPKWDGERFLGVCKTPSGVVCRVDINCCHATEFAAAQVFSTGSAEFNRSMARRARALGLTLGPRSLRPVSGPKSAEERGAPIELASEADVFARLGVRYYAPSERSWNGLRDLDPASTSPTKAKPLSDRRERARFDADDAAPDL